MTPKQRRKTASLAQNHSKKTAPTCPFLTSASGETTKCWKKGGVCSLRLYEKLADASASPLRGKEGDLRAVCPSRFRQDGIVNRTVGNRILTTFEPRDVAEVRFLRRNVTVAEKGEPLNVDKPRGAEDPQSDPPGGELAEVDAGSEDVGNIDNVLVHPDTEILKWGALEIQAVYFSGRKMSLLFEHIRTYSGPGLPFPDLTRRPDYRSSGPKRLMPQLQIKVPTLRRWGRKMAVVVDAAWFRTNMVGVETVDDLSNADIAWFLVTFNEDTDPATIEIGEPQLQTLERAVEGLTGGYPVTLSEFEAKLREKLGPPAIKKKSTRNI